MPETILLNASFAPSLILFRGPLIAEMVRRGYRVEATAPDVDAKTRAAVEALGARVTEVSLARRGLDPRGDLAYLVHLRQLIRRVEASFVLGYTIKPNIWGSLAARSCGVPSASMITGAGFILAADGGSAARAARAASQRLYRLALSCNRRVVFQNPDDVRDFAEAGMLGDARRAVVVNGSGVDPEVFRPVRLPLEPSFLMIARLLTSKGVREFAAAVEAVRMDLPGARFTLVGPLDPGIDGIAAEEVESWRARGVDWKGPLDDIRPAMAEASVFVLPSHREGTPRTVLEAMAMGRPVITTDAPGCRETVVDGQNGLLVPVRDVGALATAMRALAGDADRRAAMGAAGRARVLERYAVAAVNDALLGGLGLHGAGGRTGG